MNLREAYDRLLSDPLYCFAVMPDGQIVDRDSADFFSSAAPLHVFPGSYNPLHDGHKAIYKQIVGYQKAFELSISRINKFSLTYEELMERVNQFAWYAPILLTHHPKFVQKAGLLPDHQIVFHVGYDTAIRVAEQHNAAEIQGMRCTFVVYDRQWGDKVCSLSDLPKPVPCNFKSGGTVDRSTLGVSSTKIREGQL